MEVSRIVASLGDAAVTATNIADFDFSSTTGGNAVIIAATTGGLFRVTLSTTDPTGTIDTLQANSFFIFLNGGNVTLSLAVPQNTTSFFNHVSMYAYADSTNIGVTLCVV